MANKIDTNIQARIVSSFEGPSQSYYDAKNRFESILRDKLGVSTGTSQGYGVADTTVASNLSAMNNTSSVYSVNNVYSDVRLGSGATADAINAKLEGTGMAGLGDAFVAAEANYGVNAWFLTSVAAHESGYGTSKIAQDKNNLFGFQAYDSSPYASAATFASKADSVDYVAKYLSENYLKEGGSYYNGVSIDSIGKSYATDPEWSTKVKKVMANLLTY